MQYLTLPSILLLALGDRGNFTIPYNVSAITNVNITLLPPRNEVILLSKSNLTLLPSLNSTSIEYFAKNVGSATFSFSFVDSSKLFSEYLQFSVVYLPVLQIISQVIGWIYFFAWSISFYPQVILNFYRKSVVGLNFDFLAYNIIGFAFYGIFNACLFWSPAIQKTYFSQHPGGVNPVQLNDVIFAFHAVLITFITILQCICFEREGQRISYIAIAFISVFFLIVVISGILGLFQVISWLIFLYVLSYIKLVITLIKYVPQAYMNFKRKSTSGWSIGNVILDFTGGTFSILQMFILSFNNNDWGSIFGDPTKFGLGLFSILFDILFMIQHYILYRVPGKTCAFRQTTNAATDPLLPEEEKVN